MNRAITVRNAGFVGTVFTAAVGLLPKLTCPLCWPAYSAALGALGLGFADYTPYLMPVTAGLVALTILALAWISRRRHSIIPLVIGTFAGVLLMLGKFVLE